jgi:hypothetical protein
MVHSILDGLKFRWTPGERMILHKAAISLEAGKDVSWLLELF